jgi:hypothetical protein
MYNPNLVDSHLYSNALLCQPFQVLVAPLTYADIRGT